MDAAPAPAIRRFGCIEPLHDASMAAVIARSEQLLPAEVEQLISPLGITEFDSGSIDAAMQRYWTCVDELVAEGAERTFLTGFPVSAQIGRQACLELLAATQERTGLPASSDAEATIESLEHLGARTVAVGSRWAPGVNEPLVRYLEDGGIGVLHVEEAGQWVPQASKMSIEEGVVLAVRLGRAAAASAPAADAILLPGAFWRVLAAVPLLEEETGKPVVSNVTALPWRLMHDGWAPPRSGWGQLLSRP